MNEKFKCRIADSYWFVPRWSHPNHNAIIGWNLNYYPSQPYLPPCQRVNCNIDSDGDNSIDARPEDVEAEKGEEGNESDNDDYSSYDDSRVDYTDSGEEDGDESEEDTLTLEEVNFSRVITTMKSKMLLAETEVRISKHHNP